MGCCRKEFCDDDNNNNVSMKQDKKNGKRETGSFEWKNNEKKCIIIFIHFHVEDKQKIVCIQYVAIQYMYSTK